MQHNLNDIKEQIYFSKTKEYFGEIIRSFYGENYRSAVVMLYSVVIADLLYKLEELRDYYCDDVAEKILKEIDELRKNQPKSSEWENKLINKICAETKLIEPYVEANLENLKNIRNFSAHPSLDQNNELIAPSRETTLGLIDTMIKGIFCRPPLFIKKITQNILEDLSNKSADFLNDSEKMEKYISQKYFEKIPENMIINIFNDFWKLTFKTENDDCNRNRSINLKFLILIVKKYKLKILENIQYDKSRINNISENLDIIIYLLKFMYYYPEIYSYLSQKNKIIIDLALNNKKKYKLIAYYVYENFEKQLEDFQANYFEDYDLILLFEKKIKNNSQMNLVLNKYISFYGNSSCFNDADYRFHYLIEPNISKMSLEHIKQLLKYTNNNDQICMRLAAYSSNNIILKRANIDWSSINLKNYPNFHYNKELLKENN